MWRSSFNRIFNHIFWYWQSYTNQNDFLDTLFGHRKASPVVGVFFWRICRRTYSLTHEVASSIARSYESYMSRAMLCQVYWFPQRANQKFDGGSWVSSHTSNRFRDCCPTTRRGHRSAALPLSFVTGRSAPLLPQWYRDYHLAVLVPMAHGFKRVDIIFTRSKKKQQFTLRGARETVQKYILIGV